MSASFATSYNEGFLVCWLVVQGSNQLLREDWLVKQPWQSLYSLNISQIEFLSVDSLFLQLEWAVRRRESVLSHLVWKDQQAVYVLQIHTMFASSKSVRRQTCLSRGILVHGLCTYQIAISLYFSECDVSVFLWTVAEPAHLTKALTTSL